LGSIEELPIALGFCVRNDGDFRVSVLDGINSGRDTDSIGSMVGSVLGAMHGEGGVTADELNAINTINRFDLNASADAFSKTALAILATDEEEANRRLAQRTALLGSS